MLALPQYLLGVLMEALGPLEAERLQQLVTASVAPHLEDDARISLMDDLADQVALLRPLPPAPVVPTTQDPAAARAWFAQQGIRVAVAP